MGAGAGEMPLGGSEGLGHEETHAACTGLGFIPRDIQELPPKYF